MRHIRLLIPVLFSVMILSALCCGVFSAQKSQNVADIYTNAGIKKYTRGDFDGAIKDLQSALEFDSGNQKAKAFIVKILVDQASQKYMEKKYDKALSYIDQAKKFAPQNEEVVKMYEIITKEMEAAPSEAGASSKDMLKLFSQFQTQQEKTINTYFTPQQSAMRDMIAKIDADRKEVMVKLSEGSREVRTGIKKLLVSGIMGVAFIGLLIFIIGMYVNYSSARREAILLQHQERILNAMKDEMISLASAAQSAALPAGGVMQSSAREMISDPNPHIRAKGIEVIEAELIEEDDVQARGVAERLLQPFLDDADNRVRANAAKALFKYNKKAAIGTLLKMLSDENKWMRISAAWALGEIPSEEAANILMARANDADEHTKNRIIKSLRKISDSGVLSTNTAEKVVKIVGEVKEDKEDKDV